MDLNWGPPPLDSSFNIKTANLWVKFKVFTFHSEKILLLGFNNRNIVSWGISSLQINENASCCLAC